MFDDPNIRLRNPPEETEDETCDERFATEPRPEPRSKATRFDETEGDNVAGVLSALIVQVDAVDTFLPCRAACEGTACSENGFPEASR